MKTIFEHIMDDQLGFLEVASKCNVSYDLLERWNRKEERPSNTEIDILCELLDCFEEDLDLKEK